MSSTYPEIIQNIFAAVAEHGSPLMEARDDGQIYIYAMELNPDGTRLPYADGFTNGNLEELCSELSELNQSPVRVVDNHYDEIWGRNMSAIVIN